MMIMRYCFGESIKDCSAFFDVPEGSVKSMTFRAGKELLEDMRRNEYEPQESFKELFDKAS